MSRQSAKVSLLLPQAVLVSALAGIAGCAPQSQTPAPAVPTGMRIRLTLFPAVPRALDPVAFTVHMRDKEGKSITQARVTAELSMPSMSMPTNSFPLLPASPGTYAGQGRFTMPGKWAVVVRVTGKAGQTTQIFPIAVR